MEKPVPARNPHSLLPLDLPDHCLQCGEMLNLRVNYSTRTGLGGRRIRRFSLLGGPVGLLLFFAFQELFWEDHMDPRSFGFGMMIWLLMPVILAEGVALIWPKVRTLTCHRCHWTADFPWPKPTMAPK